MAGRGKRTVGHEQFFTDRALAQRCVHFTDSLLDLGSFSLVVEPSAGDGRFLELLPAERRTGLDLLPRHPEILAADFLSWAPPGDVEGRTLVIGNPPFGQRAALAFDFLEHASGFADAVAFILPRSFNKWTFQNRVPRSFHLAGAMGCEEFADPSGRALTIKAVFQVWLRGEQPRELVRFPTEHADFDMWHGHLSRMTAADVAQARRDYAFTVPQVGADFRPRDVADVVRGSHWFIKPRAGHVRKVFETLDFGFLDGMNTAHTSLSKSDIIRAYTAARASSCPATSAARSATRTPASEFRMVSPGSGSSGCNDGTPSTAAPAAIAAVTPATESSTATHPAGDTPSAAIACR